MRAIDAEALVIGAMIRDNSLTPDIAALVDERDFTSHFARKAFAACQSATGAPQMTRRVGRFCPNGA